MKKGDKIELSEDLAIDHETLRWGKPGGSESFLHKGRFIVDHVYPNEVWLADADWNEDGRVTYHSTKHAHIVKGKREVQFLEKSSKRFGKRFQVDYFDPGGCPARYTSWIQAEREKDIKVSAEEKSRGIYIEKITEVDDRGRPVPKKASK